MTALTASRDSTPVSPELALVDPRLAEQARKRLPVPPDTLEALGAPQPTPLSAATARRPRRWRSRVFTWTGMLVILAGTAFLVGSRADVETRTAAPPSAIAEPQPSAPRTGDSEQVNDPAAPTPSPTGAATGTRRFAWPPVAGATGYHVELFKGSAVIFRDDAKKPEILIRRLEPGAYRWYVWPLVDGRRKARAIVQAKLVVPR